MTDTAIADRASEQSEVGQIGWARRDVSEWLGCRRGSAIGREHMAACQGLQRVETIPFEPRSAMKKARRKAMLRRMLDGMAP